MICFMDMTFCASKEHKPECKRILTKKLILKNVDNLPIAWGDFCDPENPKITILNGNCEIIEG